MREKRTYITTENLTDADIKDGIDFATAFSERLAKHTQRIAGSESEKATAREIRDLIAENDGFTTRMEPFKARPLLGRRCFTFMGIWFALCLVIYLVSFLKSPVAAALVTALSLVMFIVGMVILGAMFLGSHRFDALLPDKACYNVTTEFTSPTLWTRAKDEDNVKPAPVKTVVLCANHDALPGTYFDENGSFRKVAMIVAPITSFLFVIFCIIKMCVGCDTVAKITTLVIIPAITSILGVVVYVSHFSLKATHVRENNDVATSVALAAFTYFYNHMASLPDNVRFVYSSFSAENSGHAGSRAFVAKHTAIDRGFDKAYVVAVSDVLSGSYRIAKSDALRKVYFDESVLRAVTTAAGKLDIVAPVEDNKFASLHGYIASAFAKEGIRAVNIGAKDYSGATPDKSGEDVIRSLFSLTVVTVKNLLAEADV